MDIAITAAQKIMFFYILLAISITAGSLPFLMAQNIAAIGAVIVLAAAYIMESRNDKESLAAHHATYLIRTIWIWSGFLVLCLIGAGIDIAQKADMGAIDALTAQMLDGLIPTDAQMNATMYQFIRANMDMMLRVTVLWTAPAQLYGAWRCVRGMIRAARGYRIANARTWF